MGGTRIITEASTLTVLFTDLVSSTELMNDLGDDEAARVFDEHFQILRAAAAHHGGTEVKNLGDGLMLTFSSTAGGLACAASMQRRIAARNDRAAGPSMGLRIGINAGEVTVVDHDYFGSPVVVAKRLCDRAEPGQALVSDIARKLVGSRGGYRFLDCGTLTLKGFSDPLKAFELDWRSTSGGIDLLHERDESGKAETGAAEPPPAAGAPSLPAALIAEARGEIVGRVSELSILENDLQRAHRGELRLALVAGEPGIGKTKIAAELARIADRDGWEVLYGRCDAESLVPFQPFVEALAGHIARTPSDRLRSELGSNAAVLSRLLPDIAKRLPASAAAPQSGDAETDRYLLFDATASLLRSLAAQQPLMLVLDDLHWADKPTLALLRELTRAPGATRMLILGTYRDYEIGRDHPLSALIARRHRGAPVSVIGLRGLSEREVRAMIAAWGGQAPPPDFAHGVWRETEGQPFFVRELLRHLLETGAIFQREGQVSSELSIAAIGVPEGIKQLIESRLAMLNKETQRVLTIAAVVGREFAVDVLERVSEVPADRLLELLEEAAAAGLVDSVAGAVDLYSFAHALIRETLYDDLTPPRRIRLHRRIGDALEQLHPDRSSQRLPELARGSTTCA